MLNIWLSIAAVAQASAPNSSDIESIAKVVGAVVAGLGFIFGLPLSLVQFRKTKAEIKKLELEASQLERLTRAGLTPKAYGTSVQIDGNDNFVAVIGDPRFLAPLLLLLDFIVAWILISLVGYSLNLFVNEPERTLLMGLIAILLLIPIFREARRVKRELLKTFGPPFGPSDVAKEKIPYPGWARTESDD